MTEISNEEIETIVKSAIQGNKEAFKRIYELYSGKIYTLAVRFTADPLLSQDILQDVFLRVWNKRATFKFKSSFYTWLYRLSLNVIIRKSQKQTKYLSGFSNDNIDDLGSKKNSESAVSIDSRIDIERALLRLPDQPRKIFTLYVIEGLSHNEIHKLIGISEGASKSHLSRARELLRRALDYDQKN